MLGGVVNPHLIPTMKNKTYLGDSVYAEFDGYSVVLYLDNGFGVKELPIVLEPEVLAALNAFYKQCIDAPPSQLTSSP